MAHSFHRRHLLRAAAYMGLATAASPLLVACDAVTVTPSSPAKVYRVGWLSAGAPQSITAPHLAAFRERLVALGYRDGHNVTFHYSWSVVPLRDQPSPTFEDYAAPVMRLVEGKVDVIVAENWAAAWPAKEAQSTIPVVFIVESDPAAQGFVQSLTHPGGHLTGVTHDNLAITAGKRLELLTEAVPGTRRVAVLFDPRHNPGPLPYTRTAAGALHVELVEFPVSRTIELDDALELLAQEPTDALIMFSGGVTNSDGSRILRFAREHHLPTMLDFGSWVVDATSGESALMCYSPSELALYRRLADYVDKILKGANPRDIPVERPVEYELAINLKVAEAIGVNISRSVLGRATRLIR